MSFARNQFSCFSIWHNRSQKLGLKLCLKCISNQSNRKCFQFAIFETNRCAKRKKSPLKESCAQCFNMQLKRYTVQKSQKPCKNASNITCKDFITTDIIFSYREKFRLETKELLLPKQIIDCLDSVYCRYRVFKSSITAIQLRWKSFTACSIWIKFYLL